MTEPERSPAEWQELIRELRKVVADKNRTREDRQKAQTILDRIARTPRPKPRPKVWSDESFYTDMI
jgi:hypothetical protein